MAALVECLLAKRFRVLNRITWVKRDKGGSGIWARSRKEDLRSFFTQKEEIIFCEQLGADNTARGEAGYAAKCDEARGFVFEPLRAYLNKEREAAGFTCGMVTDAFREKTGNPKSGMTGHWFGQSQWQLPTKENYQWLRSIFNQNGTQYLRRDYEDLRRPFSVTPKMQYTDVWNFETVFPYAGKHPCEKPQDLLRHILQCSTKPGSIVLDSFMGSGSMGVACAALGREFIGIEKDEGYFRAASDNIGKVAEVTNIMEVCDTPAQAGMTAPAKGATADMFEGMI